MVNDAPHQQPRHFAACQPASPDDRLIATARAALDDWEAQGEGPTSSLIGSGAIAALEQHYMQLCGVSHALALPTGTIALRVALAAAGVTPGSEVIIPALDWPAAAAATISVGATPMPADTLPGSILIDPSAVQALVSTRTTAVIATHPAGLPANAVALHALCEHHGIAFIEDASQALGAHTNDRPVGGIGTAGVFSLGAGKLPDAGEGAVLVTNNTDLYLHAVRATQHPIRQLRTGIPHPDMIALAARIHPLAAIMAIHALARLETELEQRRLAASSLIESVGGHTGVALPSEQHGERFAWPAVTAIVNPDAEHDLAASGIATTCYGLEHIPTILASHHTDTPNANLTHPRARRLYKHPALAGACQPAA